VSQQPVGAEPAEATVADPARLRTALADHIRGRGTFRSPHVEAAFRMAIRVRRAQLGVCAGSREPGSVTSWRRVPACGTSTR
jgi:hypothetical protein